jgi:Spy/CpxP family protein refolding chaperone
MKLKLWLGIFSVFFLGILVGALGRSLYKQYKIAQFIQGGQSSITSRIMKKYDRELNLTEQQYVEIEKIVEEAREELSEFYRKYQPEKDEIINRRAGRIKEHLTSEQQQKFDRISEEKRQKHRYHKNRHY